MTQRRSSSTGNPNRDRYCPRCKLGYERGTPMCSIHKEPLVQMATDPLIGHTIDRYRIVEWLGEGGMGSVYRADHTALKRSFAIKILHGELCSNVKVTARFRREAECASLVRHPNVIEVSDFGTTPEGLTYMAMELLEGRGLDGIVAAGQPLDPARIVNLARQVAAGLEAAHAKNLVHRDVKPGNVMILQTPQGERAKVLDFGIVSIMDEDDALAATRLTAQGYTLGTIAYMAPEQAEDPKVDPRADLYALGAMMYHMRTGRIPFEGSAEQIILGHRAKTPPPLPGNHPLDALIMKLLAKRKEDRPPNARAVIAALDAMTTSPKLSTTWKLAIGAAATAALMLAAAAILLGTRT